jgi:hypothetical protein
MNPPSTLPLSELFSQSWSVFTKHFKTVFILTLILSLPANFILFFTDFSTIYFGPMSVDLHGIVDGFFGLLMFASLALLTKQSLAEKEINMKELLLTSAHLLPVMLWTSLIFGLLITGWTLLLIIPGFIYGIFWFFYMDAVILNGKSGMDALHYSKSLVHGRWWEIFFRSAALGLVIALLILGLFVASGTIFNESVFNSIAFVIPFFITIDLISAFAGILFTSFYLDSEKTRLESKVGAEKKQFLMDKD